MTTPAYRFPTAQGPTFRQAAGLGQIRGVANLAIIGRSDAADAGGDWFDVRHEAIDLVYLDSAERLTVVSTSTDDSLTSTGARKILIQGLDNDWEEIKEVVEMDGTSPVLTTQAFLRVNTVLVMDVGSGEVNAGDIVLASEVTGHEQATVVTGFNRSLQTNYSIGRGKTLLFHDFIFSTGKGDEAEVAFVFKDSKAGNTWIRGSGIYVYESFGGTSGLDVSFTEKTDIKIIARAITNNPRIQITAYTTLTT